MLSLPSTGNTESAGKRFQKSFLSGCEPPPTNKTRNNEDLEESNRNYNKTAGHEHFKTVG